MEHTLLLHPSCHLGSLPSQMCGLGNQQHYNTQECGMVPRTRIPHTGNKCWTLSSPPSEESLGPWFFRRKTQIPYTTTQVTRRKSFTNRTWARGVSRAERHWLSSHQQRWKSLYHSCIESISAIFIFLVSFFYPTPLVCDPISTADESSWSIFQYDFVWSLPWLCHQV
jgi:hypothetical protein